MAVRVWVDILVLPILLAVLFLLHACAFYIRVGDHGEECFFEQGTKGAKMVLNFRVMQGGFLEIDVDITGPNNDPLFQWVRETSGRYAFTTHQKGSYRFCFSNHASTLVPETVLFTIDKDQDPRTHLFQDEDRLHVKLGKMFKKLTAAIMVVKQKQEHMEVGEKIHRVISQNTNHKVVLWSFFETAVILAMTFGQIYYMESFFRDQIMV